MFSLRQSVSIFWGLCITPGIDAFDVFRVAGFFRKWKDQRDPKLVPMLWKFFVCVIKSHVGRVCNALWCERGRRPPDGRDADMEPLGTAVFEQIVGGIRQRSACARKRAKALAMRSGVMVLSSKCGL